MGNHIDSGDFMANIKFKIIVPPQSIASLAKNVKIHGSRLWARSAIVNGSAISTGIGSMLVKKFESTDVARALRGHGRVGKGLPYSNLTIQTEKK